jgi:hypothetical protein
LSCPHEIFAGYINCQKLPLIFPQASIKSGPVLHRALLHHFIYAVVQHVNFRVSHKKKRHAIAQINLNE